MHTTLIKDIKSNSIDMSNGRNQILIWKLLTWKLREGSLITLNRPTVNEQICFRKILFLKEWLNDLMFSMLTYKWCARVRKKGRTEILYHNSASIILSKLHWNLVGILLVLLLIQVGIIKLRCYNAMFSGKLSTYDTY